MASKILEAPELKDDFYLQVLDWSSQNVTFYQWDYISSLCWNPQGNILFVGGSNGETQLWDKNKWRKIRSHKISSHKQQNRVTGSCWRDNNQYTFANQDRQIVTYDIREASNSSLTTNNSHNRKPSMKHERVHKYEICSMKWDCDQNNLASGGNDNLVAVWSAGKSACLAKFTKHTAAVKALCWNQHRRGVLLTGGGYKDGTIQAWNTLSLSHINSVNTGSQICQAMMSKTGEELITSHGTASSNLIIWNYPSFGKVALLEGHSMRTLYMSMSPDGSTVVTGSGDQMLKFWDVFEPISKVDDKTSTLFEGINIFR